MILRVRIVVLLLTLSPLLLLPGCGPAPLRVELPLTASKAVVAQQIDQPSAGMESPESSVASNVGSDTSAATRTPDGSALLSIPGLEREFKAPAVVDASQRFSATDKLSVAAEAMPLRNFLNYVFGDLLKINFVVAEGAGVLDQQITLNTQSVVSSRQIYRLTAELLASKGLSILEKDGTLLISPASGKGAGDVVIGFGRNDSDVPDTSGNILQIVPWRFGPNFGVEQLIRSLVDVVAQPAEQQNALFLTGTRTSVLRALELIRMLDQPTARSSRIGILPLTYVDPNQFIGQVSSLLEAEGIAAGTGRGDGRGVAFIPLERRGSVVIFAANPEILARVEFWGKQIDLPDRGPTARYFVFKPRYARASDLLKSLGPLIGQGASAPSVGNQSRDTRSAVGAGVATLESSVVRDRTGAGAPSAPISVFGTDISITADLGTNSIILFTTGARYEALLPMIRRLDVAPKQILLEATIAEVSLTGDFANGVEFAFRDGKLSGGTQGALGLPSSGLGLTYLGSVTDSVRMRLQATDGRVNVLSRPILMVRDGSPASIGVGTDVPVLGSSVTAPLESDRAVVSVSYRQTGIRLSITPTINAERTVLMQITQDISNSVPGASGVDGAPAFFSRAVATGVVAQSGQTVLLAGLISESANESSAGVPFLRKIPGVGAAFRSDQKKTQKTELVLLLTARIIESPEEASDVLDDLRGVLNWVELENLRPQTGGRVNPGSR